MRRLRYEQKPLSCDTLILVRTKYEEFYPDVPARWFGSRHRRSYGFRHLICCFEGLTISSGSFFTFGTWCYSLLKNRGKAIIRAYVDVGISPTLRAKFRKEVGCWEISRPNLEFDS